MYPILWVKGIKETDRRKGGKIVDKYNEGRKRGSKVKEGRNGK